MVSVNEVGANGKRGGRGRLRRLLAVGAVALVLGAILTIGVPVLRFWLQTRPIDNTVAHGDRCLDERQGANLRCWDVVAPDGVGPGAALVIDVHGFLNRPSIQLGFSEFDRLAAHEGFILAVPYGIRWSWNGGGDPWPAERELDERPGIGCCGHALNEGIDDVGFIRELIAAVVAEHAIDPTRVYVTGFSNGCMLAQRVAAEASDLVAAVACMSGFLLVDVAESYDPVPVLIVNGTDDDVTAYDPDYWPGAAANFETWRRHNGCVDEPSEVWREGEHVMVESTDCTNGARVALVTLDGIGHVTYRDHDGLTIDTSRVAWEFLASSTTAG